MATLLFTVSNTSNPCSLFVIHNNNSSNNSNKKSVKLKITSVKNDLKFINVANIINTKNSAGKTGGGIDIYC